MPRGHEVWCVQTPSVVRRRRRATAAACFAAARARRTFVCGVGDVQHLAEGAWLYTRGAARFRLLFVHKEWRVTRETTSRAWWRWTTALGREKSQSGCSWTARRGICREQFCMRGRSSACRGRVRILRVSCGLCTRRCCMRSRQSARSRTRTWCKGLRRGREWCAAADRLHAHIWRTIWANMGDVAGGSEFSPWPRCQLKTAKARANSVAGEAVKGGAAMCGVELAHEQKLTSRSGPSSVALQVCTQRWQSRKTDGGKIGWVGGVREEGNRLFSASGTFALAAGFCRFEQKECVHGQRQSNKDSCHEVAALFILRSSLGSVAATLPYSFPFWDNDNDNDNDSPTQN